jgi:hypothetical protein
MKRTRLGERLAVSYGSVPIRVSWISTLSDMKDSALTTKSRDQGLVIAISVAVVVGMAVALTLIFLWRSHPSTITEGVAYRVAVAVCPPFILVGVVTALSDSTLAVVLAAGSIVLGNASLYAGLTAFAYWVWLTFWPRSEA